MVTVQHPSYKALQSKTITTMRTCAVNTLQSHESIVNWCRVRTQHNTFMSKSIDNRWQLHRLDAISTVSQHSFIHSFIVSLIMPLDKTQWTTRRNTNMRHGVSKNVESEMNNSRMNVCNNAYVISSSLFLTQFQLHRKLESNVGCYEYFCM